MKTYLLFIALLMGLSLTATAQNRPARAVLDVGVRFQKIVNFYSENGFTVHYAHPKLVSQRLYIGASYVTSRLGG